MTFLFPAALSFGIVFYGESGVFAEDMRKVREKDGAEMVFVAGGNFLMGGGSEDYPADEKPQHEVYLSPFFIDKNEVTIRMFTAFLNDVKPQEGPFQKRWKWVAIRNDLDLEGRTHWYPAEILFHNGQYIPVVGFESHPVITVSWNAASEYCAWAGGRLPTEAEWEKAARGGLAGKIYPWGNQVPTRYSGVVYGRQWEDNTFPMPTNPVGNYPPNPLGIHDMIGNVAEWCADWYGPDYYSSSPAKDPKGPDIGTNKVLRGGAWATRSVDLRSSKRGYASPLSQSNVAGFRCVRDAQ